jgi:hypothetical protein
MPKYKNIKSGGFDSRKEERRHAELRILEAQGAIQFLETQKPFTLVPKQDGERAVTYKADFYYWRADMNEFVVEDVKSNFTRKLPVWVIKRKLMLWVHKIKVVEV